MQKIGVSHYMNGWVWEIAYPLWVQISYAIIFLKASLIMSRMCCKINFQNIVAGANLI